MHQIEALSCRSTRVSSQTTTVLAHWTKIQAVWPQSEHQTVYDIDLLEALHDLIDDTTTYLRTNYSSQVLVRIAAQHLNAALDRLQLFELALMELDADREALFVSQYWEIIRNEVVFDLRDNKTREEVHTGAGSSTLFPDTVGSGSAVGTSMRPSSRDTVTGMSSDDKSDVWCSMMCRMLAWLMLHTFGDLDQCIIPKEWRNSRMPIFIG